MIPVDAISAITPNALTLMPAQTVNSISPSQISGLTATQVTALVNSPNYQYYSTNVTTAITSAITFSTATNNRTNSGTKALQSIGIVASVVMISSFMLAPNRFLY